MEIYSADYLCEFGCGETLPPEFKERFIVCMVNGLLLGKKNNQYPGDQPQHNPVFMIWDTKPRNRNPHGKPVDILRDKNKAEKKCRQMNIAVHLASAEKW